MEVRRGDPLVRLASLSFAELAVASGPPEEIQPLVAGAIHHQLRVFEARY